MRINTLNLYKCPDFVTFEAISESPEYIQAILTLRDAEANSA